MGFGSVDAVGGTPTLPLPPPDVRGRPPGPCGCALPQQKGPEVGRPPWTIDRQKAGRWLPGQPGPRGRWLGRWRLGPRATAGGSLWKLRVACSLQPAHRGALARPLAARTQNPARRRAILAPQAKPQPEGRGAGSPLALREGRHGLAGRPGPGARQTEAGVGRGFCGSARHLVGGSVPGLAFERLKRNPGSLSVHMQFPRSRVHVWKRVGVRVAQEK